MQSIHAKTSRIRAVFLAASLTLATAATAVGPVQGPKQPPNNFDARVAYDVGPARKAAPTQQQRINALRTEIAELDAFIDPRSGVTRSLYNRTGFLTGPGLGNDAQAIAMDYLRANLDILGLSAADLEAFEVTDAVFAKVTGSTHIYLRQRFGGLPVYNGQLQVNVNRDGRIISVNNAFVANLQAKVPSSTPRLGADLAVVAAFDHLGTPVAAPKTLSRDVGPQAKTQLAHADLSRKPIDAQLMWLPVTGNEVRLVWNFQIATVDGQHHFDLNVDADTAQTWTRFDWHDNDQYRVFPMPIASPDHTSPLPPADGRVLVINPANATASPLGWHNDGSTSYTIMRGNNTHAWEDADGNESPPASQPSCGASLDCDFPLNFNQAPSNYTNASVANLFYWANTLHDVQYHYGFDEAGGNFQNDNFGNGGSGGDYVLAQGQSGFSSPGASCPNNAFFGTPPDGQSPSMLMCLWTAPNPDKDGDFDHGIMAHEFGHGVSNRQVGGPSNTSCLQNNQQGGEGWGDILSLFFTATASDLGTDGRGVGTYALNQPTTGNGIRTQRYSTSQAINNHTYESIQGMAIPHGVGEVWAQAMWEVYWALVDTHGFDADFFDVSAGAGNHRAMLYVNEGLKNTACSPTFTQARDGIVQAAVDNFSGADVCTVWEAFAAFGLGTDAVSGGSSSTNPTNGFAIPAECQCSPNAVANAGPDQSISVGNSVTVGTAAQAGHTYSWSPGGQTTAQINVSPASTTTYTVTATTSCGTAQDSATITVFNGNGPQDATFNAGLGAPSCAVAGSSCDSQSLLVGRNSQGPEPNQPNTLDVCNDGTSGTFHSDESNDQIVVSTLDSTDLTEGDTVRIDATVWAWTTPGQDTLDLYYAADANNPSWVFITSMNPPAAAAQTLSVNYTLPTGTLQAIRANFRYQGTASPCSAGNFDDHDDLVFAVASAGGNTAPTANITAPANGSTSIVGSSVSFAGTATDTEDGTISGSLSWSSSIDGAIGSGASFATTGLSLGTHTITASVTDSGGLSDSDSISITVNPVPNTAPTATITAPANGSTFTQGASVSFSGTATDTEDGTISGSLSWSSSIDGAIGNGASFSTSGLSLGTHTITASVTDSGGLSDSDSISVTIDALPNTAPTVTITGPANGTTVIEGSSLTFTGTASDTEDGSLTSSISWSSSISGALGTGGSVAATLAVGTHTITASVTDSGGLSDSDSISVTVNPDPGGGCTDCVDWSTTGTVSYSNQDTSANATVEDGGDTIFLQDNTWRRTTQTYTITANTVLEFDFQSTAQGEIHGIGFDEDDTLTNNTRIFQLHGTQTWASAFQDFNNYSGSAFTSYSIPVGQFYTGTMFLVVVNDNDAGAGNTSRFRNVRIFETAPPTCTVDDDFETSGAAGWTTSGTCSTGTFVLGNPTQQTSTVVTQVGGAASGVNALFTATNTTAGNADVDGGECVVTSPIWNVTNASTLATNWFHGQRDTGDDATGDYYVVEMSINGGAYSSVVSIGDVRTVATWANATAAVPAGSSVQLRVRVSDGAGPGDIVEGGIDDVSICDQ